MPRVLGSQIRFPTKIGVDTPQDVTVLAPLPRKCRRLG